LAVLASEDRAGILIGGIATIGDLVTPFGHQNLASVFASEGCTAIFVRAIRAIARSVAVLVSPNHGAVVASEICTHGITRRRAGFQRPRIAITTNHSTKLITGRLDNAVSSASLVLRRLFALDIDVLRNQSADV
jgi:hypothetical protein